MLPSQSADVSQNSYFQEGQYTARLGAWEYKSDPSGDMLIVETEIIGNASGQGNQIGSRPTIFIIKNNNFLGNLKNLIIAASGYGPNGEARPVTDVISKEEIDAAIGPGQIYADMVINISVHIRMDQNNKPFVVLEYSPSQGPILQQQQVDAQLLSPKEASDRYGYDVVYLSKQIGKGILTEGVHFDRYGTELKFIMIGCDTIYADRLKLHVKIAPANWLSCKETAERYGYDTDTLSAFTRKDSLTEGVHFIRNGHELIFMKDKCDVEFAERLKFIKSPELYLSVEQAAKKYGWSKEGMAQHSRKGSLTEGVHFIRYGHNLKFIKAQCDVKFADRLKFIKSPKLYLSFEQVAKKYGWSRPDIPKLIKNGTLVEDIHFFRYNHELKFMKAQCDVKFADRLK